MPALNPVIMVLAFLWCLKTWLMIVGRKRRSEIVVPGLERTGDPGRISRGMGWR